MDAVKFLKEHVRMCSTVPECKGCPFHVFIPQTTIIWVPALVCMVVAACIFWCIMEE